MGESLGLIRDLVQQGFGLLKLFKQRFAAIRFVLQIVHQERVQIIVQISTQGSNVLRGIQKLIDIVLVFVEERIEFWFELGGSEE